MADLEVAADLALAKTRELSVHVDRAEAALEALEEMLQDVKGRFDVDWNALEEEARDLLERARAQTRGIDDEGEDARQAIAQLDESVARANSDWGAAIEGGIARTSALGAHISEQHPLVSTAGQEAAGATRGLAERADAIEAQLQQVAAELRGLMETDVVDELRRMQDAVRQRAEALQASLAEQCDTVIPEAIAAWEQQLAQVEEVVEQEFARARQHAADVVDFSLAECRHAHDEAWSRMTGLVDDLETALQRLADAVVARTAELGEHRGAADEALAGAAESVDRMRTALVREREAMARYEFVRP